jgi:predicted phage terminase large subunit-like protein
MQFTRKGYKAGFFHKKMGKVLEKFLEDVIAEKSPRLIIIAPPRHGKSEEASRCFPAFALGKYPDVDIIATSYASDLASSINRDIQRIIDSPEYHELFPDTTLWGTNIRTVADGSYLRNSDIFEIVDHKGVYKSAGVGAGVTGRGARIILVDDPVKDAAEAGSETIRQGIWDWFTSTLYTRLMPGGGIIIIMTRWHEDDLVGRILANMKIGGEHYDVFHFPAIAEHDEVDEETGELYRKTGEALHPERYPLKALERIKLGTSDKPGVGSKVWASLYQGHPAAAEGNLFKIDNWGWHKLLYKRYSDMTQRERRELHIQLEINTITQTWDTALGIKKQNDYSACVTLGIAKNRFYVLDVWKDRLQFPDVKRQVELQFDAWAIVNKVNVEGGGSASGKATVQAVQRDSRVPIFEVIHATDKVLRADTITPYHEGKMIYFLEGPHGEKEAWQSDFIEQCSNFPNAKHDDDVDAFIGAMEDATGGEGPIEISDELLALAEAGLL